MSVHFWLRAESKAGEARTPLTPSGAQTLRDRGLSITVERSATRAFSDDDYAAAGAALVDTGSWMQAPADAVILGLKELPSPTPAVSTLRHRHVYFAHAFKEQAGWQQTLCRFIDGGGSLYDLEYLKGDSGRRVAAFGYWAGFVGAAVGVLAVCAARRGERLGALSPWTSQAALVDGCRTALAGQPPPTSIVLGARGRSGSGALAMLEAVGAKTTAWDLAETTAGGPFADIVAHELFINAVLVMGAMPPFVTAASIASNSHRRLRVVADVSCDPHSPHNPVPIYDDITTMITPTVRVAGDIDVVAIDHLPSLLPVESSSDFAEQLLPHLLTFGSDAPVWAGAEAIFRAMALAATTTTTTTTTTIVDHRNGKRP